MTAVLGAVIAALAALAGVHLTQHHQRAQRREEKREQRLLEQRDTIVDFLVAVRRWHRSAYGLQLILATHDAVQASGHRAVEDHGEVSRAYEVVEARARIVVTEPRVRDLLLEVCKTIAKWPDLNADLLKSGGGVTAMKNLQPYWRGLREAIERLELEAMTVWAPTPVSVTPHTRHRLLRPRSWRLRTRS